MNKTVTVTTTELNRMKAAEQLVLDRLKAQSIQHPAHRIEALARCKVNETDWKKTFLN